MRDPGSVGWATLRAAIAVVALYALACQTILAGALATGFATPVHRLCLQPDGPGADRSGLPAAPQGPLPCCTAAHLPQPVPAPDAPGGAIAWPARPHVALAWRDATAATPRARPGARPNARDPPAA